MELGEASGGVRVHRKVRDLVIVGGGVTIRVSLLVRAPDAVLVTDSDTDLTCELDDVCDGMKVRDDVGRGTGVFVAECEPLFSSVNVIVVVSEAVASKVPAVGDAICVNVASALSVARERCSVCVCVSVAVYVAVAVTVTVAEVRSVVVSEKVRMVKVMADE